MILHTVYNICTGFLNRLSKHKYKAFWIFENPVFVIRSVGRYSGGGAQRLDLYSKNPIPMEKL